ncbi:MAG TPA: DUF2075 domain-containing protein [Chitinophagaceae bacterium]|jgi:DUF2075 family protein|nr:DUF2075 domain-containing protein [Chitinophagaceae bacterium]
MNRYFYTNSISNFLTSSSQEIFGALAQNRGFADELTQKEAWNQEIVILKGTLKNYQGNIFFEYSIPRMGRRIDVVLVIKNVIFILEFKVGEREFVLSSIDQVWDYALDLKNFHETSHAHLIAPILIATEADDILSVVSTTAHNDNLLLPIKTNSLLLKDVIEQVLQFSEGESIDAENWSQGRYSPTPTIIEAAMSLYNEHGVKDIYRNDASAINLSETSNAVLDIILKAKTEKQKAICFVTGVPGAGKTLVGLNIGAKNYKENEKSSTVFLSGNGPLVAILREALTRDKLKREKEKGNKLKKGEVFSQVKSMIQNVHHFRDECLQDSSPPFEHVTIFDEAQRAWNITQTSSFMKRKKGISDFSISEPEFLISCLDRHQDWAVIVCLVGGGQEINTGEAGISEWIESLNRSFPEWHIYVSNRLTDSEYAAGEALQLLEKHKGVTKKDELHLSVSLRSFRAEHVSLLVKNILDINIEAAKENYKSIHKNYPLVITRDLGKAKRWLKEKARGSERYGIVVSSQAQRLKPHTIDVKSPMDPIHWFLDGKEDIRSSYYLEDVATEFQVQGLELDWACVTWDADFRYSPQGWQSHSFVGSKWNNINKEERKLYLKNAYRVLLTRARQGMIIVIPNGTLEDATRNSSFYDPTFEYLISIGIELF